MLHEAQVLRGLRVIGLLFFSLLTLFPLYTVVISSIKPLQDVESTFHWVPTRITFSPYFDMWSTIPLAKYFLNSFIVSFSATIISTALAILAAYSLSRYRFFGREFFRLMVLSTQMFPGILFLLPLFILFINIESTIGIKLYGSYTGLIITYLTFSLPFAIWSMVGYLNGVPRDLDEAARIDGASPLATLLRVIIPVSTPGIIAVAIYCFMTAWGEVLFASVLTTDATRTLAIGLESYSSQANVYWNQLMAASIVVSIPVVLGFLALQRYLVQGATAGAVKG